MKCKELLAGALVLLTLSARTHAQEPDRGFVTRKDVVAIYFGTFGTDSMSGMVPVVQSMNRSLARQAVATGRRFFSRGVSLEPSVSDGLRHLALFGGFDEESLGGNWTNAEVIRYLGPKFDTTRTSGIPQVVLIQRELTQSRYRLEIVSEREIGRFVGTKDIADWVRAGANLPR
jgi:hypothetical protein